MPISAGLASAPGSPDAPSSGAPAHLGPARQVDHPWRKRLLSHLPGFVSLLVFVGVWQAAVLITDPNPIVLPSPAQVVQAFWDAVLDGQAWEAMKASAFPLAVGMAISMIAIPIGLAIGLSPIADLVTSPYLWGFFALPNIAFAPLLILFSGFGTATSIWMVFLSASVPLCLSCKDGVQTVDQSLVRAARAFGARRLALFYKVIVPCAMPFIASGVRNAISRGFVGLLSVELLVGAAGIGGEVMQSSRVYDTARMFAFVFLLIAIALLLVSGSRRLEVWASRWREEVVL
ncbi:ABC transporter permease [Nocardioides caldifontis]|uniref:ABC transporter permease n=1 Tax=Nocardioides caldifontis TaxID=2588938 RepID=UPI001EF09D3B|nr:ABC transporter permease subunit [Nocardioides caldifontis]